MDNRYAGIVFVVFGIIALIGSVIFMFVLLVVGQGLDAIRNADPEFISQTGADPASLQSFYQQTGQIMSIGWVWAVSVVVSSLASVYSCVKRLRPGKKQRA